MQQAGITLTQELCSPPARADVQLLMNSLYRMLKFLYLRWLSELGGYRDFCQHRALTKTDGVEGEALSRCDSFSPRACDVNLFPPLPARQLAPVGAMRSCPRRMRMMANTRRKKMIAKKVTGKGLLPQITTMTANCGRSLRESKAT